MKISAAPDKKRHPLMPLFISITIFLFLIGVSFVLNTWTVSMRNTENDAKLLALAAEAGFQKSHLPALEGNLSDLDKSEYKEIKGSLINISHQENAIRFAYIYTLKNGKIYFLADSEPENSPDYSPPGQEYGEADSQTFEPFQTGKTVLTRPTKDRWGTWVSVLVPMKNAGTGETVAVFGVDYPANTWYDHALGMTFQSAIIVLCLYVIAMALHFAFIRNKELKREKYKLIEMSEKLNTSETLFRSVFEQAPMGIAVVRNSFDIQMINPAFENTLGRTTVDLSSSNWGEYTHPDDLQADVDNFTKFQNQEIPSYSMKKRYIKPDDSLVWVNMTISPLHMNGGAQESNNHLCMIENISEQITAENALRESERSKSVLLSHLPGMAYRCCYDREWTMQFVSAGCYSLTGYQPESLLQNKELSFNDLIAPEYRDFLWQEWERILPLHIPFKSEYEILSADGSRKWVLEMGQGIYNDDGAVEALEGIVMDVTPLKEREAQISYISTHDYLTGLHNRIDYENSLTKMNSPEFLPLSIIITDITGLRMINDTFGYQSGDKLIMEAAHILQSCCRPGDILARVGGDEFGFILPNTDAKTSKLLIEIIESNLATYNQKNKSKLYDINLSISSATKETLDENLLDVIKTADEILRNRQLFNQKSFHNDIISSILAAIYEKSQETEEHAKRLASLSKKVGEKLDLSQKSLCDLELFAMLHDIGKVGIDEKILNSPNKLSEFEWAMMKKHPEIGYRIAKASSELEPVAEYILSHHERWDGKGYPQGLKEEEIPLLSRILAVADAYDAMTEDRVYRKALSQQQAIDEILKNAGTQFDPEIAALFIENL